MLSHRIQITALGWSCSLSRLQAECTNWKQIYVVYVPPCDRKDGIWQEPYLNHHLRISIGLRNS